MDLSPDTKTLRNLQSENIRLKAENTAMRKYVERLQDTLTALVDLQKGIDEINAETNIFLLIHNLLEAALTSLDSANGSLMLLDEDTGELVFVEVIGQAQQRLVNKRLPRDAGIAGQVMKTRQAVMLSDANSKPTIRMSIDHYMGLSTKTVVCVPLLDGERRLGVIEVVNSRSGRNFEAADRDVLELVGRLASLAIVAAEKASA